MNFQDVLNSATNGVSDGQGARNLGVTRQRFSNWRNQRDFPSDDAMLKMEEITGIAIEKIYFAVMAEKCHIPRVAKEFRHLAA